MGAADSQLRLQSGLRLGEVSLRPPDPAGLTGALCTAQRFVLLGAGLTFLIQFDLLEKSRVLRLPLKPQERPVFVINSI